MTNIDTRPLGHSGIQVSVVGLGCNQFGGRLDLEGTRAVIDSAISNGITFLDTADRYGNTKSEEFIGDALKGRRDEVVLATKFGMDLGDGWTGPRGAPDYIQHAVEGSLRRLQTNVIDVYWYHRPDGLTPIADTLEGLDALVKAGTVRAIGASNFGADQIAEADAIARERGLTRFTAIQNEYSLLHRDAEADVLPLCEQLEIAFVPYYPLASGLLTGKYQRDAAPPEGARLSKRDQIATDEQWDLVEALGAYAEERGVPLTDVAIGALLAQPAVASVIAGATKPEQLASNASAANWKPSAGDLAALRALLA
ncbi:MAG TPA: aldo/keto reductase [Solirubrobacteraceae bacterium]|jgi:aryl-alcohol dehydrogenase-like predicted oxidoreductase|nr:aldo/keto reductase [Solirubrobacteraceae bacterium]